MFQSNSIVATETQLVELSVKAYCMRICRCTILATNRVVQYLHPAVVLEHMNYSVRSGSNCSATTFETDTLLISKGTEEAAAH